MRPVSQTYKDAFLSDTPDVKREVSYKRRYWDATDQEYKWEADWTTLAEDRVENVTPITEQLDLERLNEFKVSNLTLTLKNEDNRWRQDNPAGVFGPDAASPLYPYSDYWTKFRIRIGVRLLDGTYEYTSRFVGFAVEFTHSSQDTVQITVQGMESLLQNANAENVSTRVVNENAGSGNGVTVDFVTDQPGVGIIEEVSVAGITQVAGTDYDVSNLNEPTLGATVTFHTAPVSGTVRITYRYWQQAQTVEALVSDLLTEAGIAPGDQLVDPVLFPGGVTQSFSQTTQGDWQAGSLTSIDALYSAGDLLVDMIDNDNKVLSDDFSGALSFTKQLATANINIVSGELEMGPETGGPPWQQPSIYKASTRVQGAWQFDVRQLDQADELYFYFMGGAANTAFSVLALKQRQYGYLENSYAVFIDVDALLIKLVRYDTSTTVTTVLASASISSPGSGAHTIWVGRSHGGKMEVYYDGSLTLSATDNTHTTSSNIMISDRRSDSGVFYIDNVYTPSATGAGTFVSQTLDALTAPSAWGRLTATEVIGTAGSITYYTRVSTDGISWDAYVAVAGNGQINSALKRYIQFKAEMVASTVPAEVTKLEEVQITYTSSATLLTLANFTGKTVYQQIQEFGRFSNYEFGPTPDEEFFFRAKDASQVADATLTKGVNLSEITGLVSGYDRVYSEVRATYGAFTSTVRVAGDTEGDARAKNGSRILDISGGDVLVADDANIAAGVAAGLAAEVRRPRRRMKASCKLLPYIDLSDVVLVYYDQNIPQPSWFHGDTTVDLGDQSLQHHGGPEQLVGGMYAKVVGARHDPDNFKTELDLQEVL